MSIPSGLLVNSIAEISELRRSARGKSGGQVILVPVDFSDHSAAALEHAAILAEQLPAALIVLHVIHDPGEMPGYYAKLIKPKYFERIQDIAEQAFREFILRMIESNPDRQSLKDARLITVLGLPATRILEVVGELDPLMVVMGCQGRTSLKNMIIGSKAAQIVQLCPVPVSIVKRRERSSED